jgi:hypothetical protein
MFRLAVILLCATTASAANAQRAARPTTPAPARPAANVRPIDGSSVAATLKQGAQCRAFAPSEWRVIGARQTGDAFDLSSADGMMYAGWGMRGVNRSMERVYGALYSDPETSSLAVAGAALQSMGSRTPPRYTAAPLSLGAGFNAREFASSTHKGLLVYRVYPAPPGFAAGSYIISLRIAAAESRRWDADGKRIAVGVAASINCATMLHASRNDVDLPRPGDPPGMRKRSGETDDLADYNPQLGTQWVHSETTGERYLVDHSATWNETGPDGPGYYKRSGTTYEKLTPGFGGDP